MHDRERATTAKWNPLVGVAEGLMMPRANRQRPDSAAQSSAQCKARKKCSSRSSSKQTGSEKRATMS